MVEWWARRLTVWYETSSHVRYTYRESSTRIATPQVQEAPEHDVNKACTYKGKAIFSMLKYIWYTTETRLINSPLRFSFCGDREQTLLPCIYRVLCYQTSKDVDLFEACISCLILYCPCRKCKPVFKWTKNYATVKLNSTMSSERNHKNRYILVTNLNIRYCNIIPSPGRIAALAIISESDIHFPISFVY